MKSKINLVPLFYFLSIVLVTSLLISCGKDEKKTETKQKTEKVDSTKSTTAKTNSGAGSPGKELFYMKSASNNIACADCHSDGTNAGNPLTKYFSNIQGANKRTSTFNGLFTGEEVVKNAGGATLCWEAYERMKTPLTQEQIKALNEYYEAVAGQNSPVEIKYETIALPKRDKAKLKEIQKTIMGLKGDPTKGQQSFDNACGFCHGENSTVKKVPTILEEFDGNIKGIVYKVRLGDDAMPLFHSPNLTDQDIADISAYVMQKNKK